MKKTALFALLGVLLFSCTGCGGGGGSVSMARTSAVTIEFRGHQPATALKSIPAEVVLVSITVSAPDMRTLEATVPLAAETLSTTLQVPNGLNRHFVVEAFNAAAVALYRGETYASLDGSPATLAIALLPTGNTTPPDFKGLGEVRPLSTSSLLLTWGPGSDNATPTVNLQYLVYMATESGAEDMTTPTFTVPGGMTQPDGLLALVVNGLQPGTTYYFRVRAMDEQGNIDPNTAEKYGTTLLEVSADATPPAFGGIVSAVANSENVIQISWQPAADLVTPSADITYRVYKATQSGGQDFSMPALTTLPGETAALVPNLTSGVTYYFVVRAVDAAGNSDTNTAERSATTFYTELQPLFGTPVINVATYSTLPFGVRNNGTEYAYNVEAWLIYGSGNAYSYCEPYTVWGIGPGAQVSFTTGFYYQDYLLVVDPYNRIRESNETNNRACLGAYCTNPPQLPSTCIPNVP